MENSFKICHRLLIGKCNYKETLQEILRSRLKCKWIQQN